MHTTKIIARYNQKGIVFPDRSLMLSRQGCSNTVNAGIDGVSIEARIAGHLVACDLSYGDGNNGRHQKRGSYYFRTEADQTRIFPAEMENDVLNFVELHTGARPQGLRQQIHAYINGKGSYPYQDDDIILSPFHYDSATRTLIEASTKSPVATLADLEDEMPDTRFETSMVSFLTEGTATDQALKKALAVGFHQCDKQKGIDYCLRRLTWLAGCYYQAERKGHAIHVYVLQPDMQKSATLTEPGVV